MATAPRSLRSSTRSSCMAVEPQCGVIGNLKMKQLVVLERREKAEQLDGQGRARREAARRRKSECEVNLLRPHEKVQ